MSLGINKDPLLTGKLEPHRAFEYDLDFELKDGIRVTRIPGGAERTAENPNLEAVTYGLLSDNHRLNGEM